MSNPDQVKKVEPRRLKGFKDYMPAVMERRSQIQALIRRHAALGGYREIGTPTLEYLETLLGQGSEETDKQVYRFEDHGGRKVGMRFDLTIPFARFVAEHQGELVFPFKRLQIGDVWRGENTQKGRYREFCQCDLDIIGVDSVNADIEVLTCIFRVIADLELKFTMRFGNRLLLSAMIKTAFTEIDSAGEQQALIALDKLDKIGSDGVCELLAKIPGADAARARNLLQVLSQKDAAGGTDQEHVSKFLQGNARALEELKRMQTILDVMNDLSLTKTLGTPILDLAIARGLGYYTGVVYETTLDDLPGFGSISSGGRYDNLAERFTNRSLPGVGGSVGLDRLIGAMEELSMIGAGSSPLLFIAVATPDAAGAAAKLASQLRDAGIACDIGLTSGKVGNQFKHADRLGCSYVITLGSDEIKTSTYGLKKMKTGEETKGLPLQNIVPHVKSLVQGAEVE